MNAFEHLTQGVDCGVKYSGLITALTTLATAPTATSVFYITDLILVNADAALQTISIASGVTTQLSLACAANGGGLSHSFIKPLRCAAGNLTGTPSGAGIYVTVNGFWLPS